MKGRFSGGMEHVPRKSPLPREEFHAMLREWHAEAAENECVSDEDVYDGDDWVWIKHLGNRYYLHARTTAAGVGRYLALLRDDGESIRWHASPGEGDREVGFGMAGAPVEDFLVYRAT